MNATELKARFPNATSDFLRLNADQAGQAAVLDNHSGTAPELERHIGNGAVGEVQVQAGIGRRVLVRVTAYRHRLLDEDNLCEKFHVDLCRYAGVIPSDAPGRAKIEVCQEKVGSKEPEETKIEVFEVCPE